MILDYEPGDKVTNPNNKDWGIGQVQSIINEKVTVNFENVGKKVINAKNIELKKLSKFKMDIKKIVEDLIDTFLKAGELSLSLREKGLKKEIKSDNTPVSNGDLEVNKFITKKISEITPDIPIISEETSDNKDNTQLKDFWLVDPIDGTYDYINDLEEFTINAGLIINNKPVAGLINAPAKKRMFYSYGEGNAYELSDGKTINLSEKVLKKLDQLNLFLTQIKLNQKFKKSIKILV